MNSDWHEASLKLIKDPNNFNLWQELVYHAEFQNKKLIGKTLDQDQIEILRRTYQTFLSRYPLLSKYWSSFARWEFLLGNKTASIGLFCEGLRYVSHDVEYWISYLNFELDCISDDLNTILRLFEEARFKIGYSYYSSEFYGLYLSFLKTFATPTNGFEDKLVTLMRQIVEIPIYNNSHIFNELIEFVSPGRLTHKKLACLLPESQLKEIKDQTCNNLGRISKLLINSFQDVFSVTQFEIHQIFNYERQLGKYLQFGPQPMSSADVEVWLSYFDYVEQNYPFIYTQQLYERAMSISTKEHELVVRYFDFLMSFGEINSARSLLERILTTECNFNSTGCFLRLIDLEINFGNVERARDLILSCLEVNERCPLSVYEKLIEIEALRNCSDDGIYLCELTKEIMNATRSAEPLFNLKKYAIANEVLLLFLSEFVKDGGKHQRLFKLLNLVDSRDFWNLYRSLQ